MAETEQWQAGSSLPGWLVCKCCRFVFHAEGEQTTALSCGKCSAGSDEIVPYFDHSLSVTVNFMMRAIQSGQGLEETGLLSEDTGSHSISVLVFFCIFRELLLDRLLNELASATGIADASQLLSRHRLYAQKQQLLFPQFCGRTWESALEQLHTEAHTDYRSLDLCAERLAELRNRFIYLGYGWQLEPDKAQECVETVEPLIELHVSLHNRYVHPHYTN